MKQVICEHAKLCGYLLFDGCPHGQSHLPITKHGKDCVAVPCVYFDAHYFCTPEALKILVKED